MNSDLGYDFEGGRGRRLAIAVENDDAVPLGQLLELIATLPAKAAGYPTFPPGGGGGGGFPVSPGGGGPGVTFADANNVSFGTMGNAVVTAIANINVSVPGSSVDLNRVVFSNENGVTFGLTGSTITASIPAGVGGSINVSAGTTSNNLTAVTFANGNGVSFGINNSVVTASVSQSVQTLGFYFSSQTTGQSSSSTFDARSVTFRGVGIVSVGASAGEVIISVPAGGGGITAVNLSAGTTSNNLTNAVFSNSNNVSFGLNGSTITASATVASTQGSINLSAGTTSNLASAFTFANANGISFGLDASTITASYTVPTVTNSSWTASDGATSLTIARLAFTNLNGVTLTLSTAAGGSATLVGSVATSLTAINLSAGTTSNNLSAVTFSNSNNVSFGLDGSTITATASFAQSNQTLGLYASSNTTAQSSSSTVDARSFTIRGMGVASVGLSAGEFVISVPAGGGGITAINLSAGTTSNNLTAFTLSNSNNVSFGLDGSVVTATVTVATSLTNILVSAGTTSNLLSAVTFANANGVSFGLDASTITASVSQSAQTLGLYASSNTTAQSSSSTVDARSFTIRGMGVASVGLSAGEFVISVPAGGGGITAINVSAGTTSNNLTAFTLSNANNVSFGLDGSTITATVTVATSLTAINVSAGTTSNNLSAITFSNANGVSFGLNASVVTASYASRVTAFSQHADFATNFTISNATFSIQKVSIPMYVSATRAMFLMDLTGNSNSTGALTISFGVYTMSGSTASLATSGSRNLTWTTGNQADSSRYGGVSGTRYRTLAIDLNLTPGDYLFGVHFRTTNNGTWRAFGRPAASIVGALDANETNYWLDGTSNASFTTAMAASINVTDTNYARTGAAALRQPGVILIGTF